MTRAERVAMIDRGHADLSVRRQCALLGLARSGVYRQPAVNAEELALMRWIDEQYLATPFYGSRRMAAALRLAGHQVNRKRVQRLMRLMGLQALGPKPKTSRPSAQHRIYPYLLRGLAIDRPNQVWAADITYIPMAPFLRASSSASRQNEMSIVFDRRQARTYRLYQSMTTIR